MGGFYDELLLLNKNIDGFDTFTCVGRQHGIIANWGKASSITMVKDLYCLVCECFVSSFLSLVLLIHTEVTKTGCNTYFIYMRIRFVGGISASVDLEKN